VVVGVARVKSPLISANPVVTRLVPARAGQYDDAKFHDTMLEPNRVTTTFLQRADKVTKSRAYAVSKNLIGVCTMVGVKSLPLLGAA